MSLFVVHGGGGVGGEGGGVVVVVVVVVVVLLVLLLVVVVVVAVSASVVCYYACPCDCYSTWRKHLDCSALRNLFATIATHTYANAPVHEP